MALVMITYSALYFREQMQCFSSLPKMKDSSFWVVCGIFFYYSSNLFLFAFSGVIQASTTLVMSDFWHLHSVNLFILYTCLTIALRLESGWLNPYTHPRKDKLARYAARLRMNP
ncbi:MAG: hypothetical protein ACFB10_15155 [Salibacteraceae bacterium]